MAICVESRGSENVSASVRISASRCSGVSLLASPPIIEPLMAPPIAPPPIMIGVIASASGTPSGGNTIAPAPSIARLPRAPTPAPFKASWDTVPVAAGWTANAETGAWRAGTTATA